MPIVLRAHAGQLGKLVETVDLGRPLVGVVGDQRNAGGGVGVGDGSL